MDDKHQITVETVDRDGVPISPLNLSSLPPIYVLATHLSVSEQHEAEDALVSAEAPLTYDIKEANLILAVISKSRRAKLELQWKGVLGEDLTIQERRRVSDSSSETDRSSPERKRRKLGAQSKRDVQDPSDKISDASTTASETEDEINPNTKTMSQLSLSRGSISPTVSSPGTIEASEPPPPPFDSKSFVGKVKVVKLDWLHKSLVAGEILDLTPFTVYEAKLLPDRAIERDGSSANTVNRGNPLLSTNSKVLSEEKTIHQSIIERAKADLKPGLNHHTKYGLTTGAASSDVVGKSFPSTGKRRFQRSSQNVTRRSQLLHQTTSEHDEAASSPLPPMPDWVLQKRIYACERATPLNSPNNDFICQLKKIKLARLLSMDEIGVRAYSSSIASLAAYPHPIRSTREILALPSCDQKIAQLFHEWKSKNGLIQAVADFEADPALSTQREFYEIWGVGAKTAREFYHDKGWRDLDDIVEFGWKTLSRVQQIGLKYYDEFLLKIPRAEVESITDIITHHAKLLTDTNVEAIIVGGYRRGKPESGDVDIILSHREESMTHNLVGRVVKSLEDGGWITHTLTLNLTNTKRNQEPLPINTATQVGHGFDTLDKALVVWQDPNWSTKAKDLAANPKAKNPNPHRRVDIIISPWRTVGCAIAGWTSGTTFQRDLRRYAKYVKGWKFDSSGVRERGTGRWVDLERWTDPETRCQDWREAEKRVFEGMGLVYREPWDRCTG